MESALTPREIQARIRAGETVEDVADAAGVPASRIEPFAVPVVAEREFIALQAQQHPARRGGETIPHRNLKGVVEERLASRQIDAGSVSWDAWLVAPRRWLIEVGYPGANRRRSAHFRYDQSGRFSVPDNDDARWLLGLHSSAPDSVSPLAPPESEPTIGLNDELALVRVVQDEPGPDDTQPLPPDAVLADLGPDFAEGELTEVDGVYDIVPGPRSSIDVLYEMLSSFDEDSVQIYSGLVRSAGADEAVPVVDDGPNAAQPAGPGPDEPTPPEPGEPEQPALVDTEEPEPTTRPARKRKRAQVPSWDEIMFGSPGAPRQGNPKKR